ncbi:MAG: exodeoxyribonuclease VII small subunit [Bacillota bacterium]|nr:exodeoxyribonuclease VII small subunit [Bacillota bacterium]
MDEQLTFEQISARIDEIVTALEGGELPLEQMLEQYARGVELIAIGRARLNAAEAELAKGGLDSDDGR